MHELTELIRQDMCPALGVTEPGAIAFVVATARKHTAGAVKDRSQTFNPVTKQWVKRDSDTGRFMDVKKDGTPFKGVRKEK